MPTQPSHGSVDRQRTKSDRAAVALHKVGPDCILRPGDDRVAVEEPLEIRLIHYRDGVAAAENSISVTMRTPGEDAELAAGFLFAESILESRDDIVEMLEGENTMTVTLGPEVVFDSRRLLRHFFTSSSCGVCGRASIEALEVRRRKPPAALWSLSAGVLATLPARLRERQPLFSATAGTHAAGLFGRNGEAHLVREDVGRHNAVDKLIGRRLLDDTMNLAEMLLVVSGRTSFDILQKAIVAGIPMVVAVGAPSSLAVELAQAFGLTLAGFVGRDTFNVYSGADRIA